MDRESFENLRKEMIAEHKAEKEKIKTTIEEQYRKKWYLSKADKDRRDQEIKDAITADKKARTQAHFPDGNYQELFEQYSKQKEDKKEFQAHVNRVDELMKARLKAHAAPPAPEKSVKDHMKAKTDIKLENDFNDATTKPEIKHTRKRAILDDQKSAKDHQKGEVITEAEHDKRQEKTDKKIEAQGRTVNKAKMDLAQAKASVPAEQQIEAQGQINQADQMMEKIEDRHAKVEEANEIAKDFNEEQKKSEEKYDSRMAELDSSIEKEDAILSNIQMEADASQDLDKSIDEKDKDDKTL